VTVGWGGASRRRPWGGTWLWALIVALVVAVVMAGAYAGHRYVASARLAAIRLPAPAVAPASITTVLRLPAPDGSAAFMLPTGQSDRLAVLAGPGAPVCPPVGACLPPPPLDALLLLDTSRGTILARTPLDGTSQQPVTAATDPARQAVYVISTSAIAVFSTTTGQQIGGYPLPAGIAVGRGAGATVAADGTVLLTAKRAGQPILMGVIGASGAVRFAVAPGGAVRLDGPVLDAATGLALVLIAQADGATLAAYTATDGTPRGSVRVPAGMRLGPVDDARQAIMLFGSEGTTWRLPLAGLVGAGSPPGVTAAAALAAVPSLRGADALGWNAALGHVYRADASGLRILDDATGRTLAALPLPVAWAPDVPLPSDVASGRLLLLTDGGTIASIRDAPDPVARVPAPDTAAALARAALTQLLPPDPQNPPFVTADTFPLGAGTRDAAFWVYSATPQPRAADQGVHCQATGYQTVPTTDLHWQGPFCGSAQVQVAPAPGGRPGTYDVTFTLTWEKLFEHRRTWTYRVMPDGAVQLVRDAGDALP
jgi:hypothetical protein